MRVCIRNTTGGHPSAVCCCGVGKPWHWVQYWFTSFAPPESASGTYVRSGAGGIAPPIIIPSIHPRHMPPIQQPIIGRPLFAWVRLSVAGCVCCARMGKAESAIATDTAVNIVFLIVSVSARCSRLSHRHCCITDSREFDRDLAPSQGKKARLRHGGIRRFFISIICAITEALRFTRAEATDTGMTHGVSAIYALIG